MANRSAAVKQSDLTRYLNAASKAGLIVSRIEVVSDGTVRLFTLDSGPDETSNPCDRLLK